jgi:hypothetical protein
MRLNFLERTQKGQVNESDVARDHAKTSVNFVWQVLQGASDQTSRPTDCPANLLSSPIGPLRARL